MLRAETFVIVTLLLSNAKQQCHEAKNLVRGQASQGSVGKHTSETLWFQNS